ARRLHDRPGALRRRRPRADGLGGLQAAQAAFSPSILTTLRLDRSRKEIAMLSLCRRPIFTALYLASAIALGPFAAQAADDSQTPLTEFKSQFKDVRKNLETAHGKIQNGAKAIESLSDPQSARKQVEELQALVSETLGLVSDNGDFAQLGAKALDYS